jgi:hypothetical protein
MEHGGHGGSAAAPIARKVIDAYFERKNSAVTKNKPPLTISQRSQAGIYR